MSNTKQWYQSKTIWGIIMTAIAFAAHTYLQADVVIPPNADFDQLKQIVDQTQAAHGNFSQLITVAMAGIGVILGIIGRVKAKSIIAPSSKSLKMIAVIALLSFMGSNVNAQMKVSPFKPLPKPQAKYGVSIITQVKSDTSAWRFSGVTGYNVTTKQIMAGVAYGIQWLHFDASTQKYYTDFSVQAVGWVNGSTPPTLNPPNFASFGLTVGILNQLVQLGGAYTPATPLTKSQIGFVVNIGIALNN